MVKHLTTSATYIIVIRTW